MINSIPSDFVQQESCCPSPSDRPAESQHESEGGDQADESENQYRAEPEQQLPRGFFFQEDNLMWSANSESKGVSKAPIFVCSRLDVVAIVRDKESNNHGRLLEFRDSDGNLKRWTMPMALLAGDGSQYRSELLSMGLIIGGHHSVHSLLSTYIKLVLPKDRLTCVNRIGWYGNQFVLPQRIFGESKGEKILLQDVSQIHNVYTVSGTMEEWKARVSKLCFGNPRLVFALGCAFAPPLAHLLGLEGGGFHFYGRSSSGKTTVIRVAASVWGGDQYMESWRTTVNGLEGTALLHNDTLLCLDEISQMPPDQVGEAAYLLANGAGKARANIQGE